MNNLIKISLPMAALLNLVAAHATQITRNPHSWQSTITFEEMQLANNATVTNQYSPFGLTFSRQLLWFKLDSATNWGGIVGAHVFDGHGDEEFQPLTLRFSAPVSSAGFNFRASDATRNPLIQFTALLNGVPIESFSTQVATSFTPLPEQFYGFAGLFFNEIRIEMNNPAHGPPCCGTNIDNISMNFAAVPEPSTKVLITLGLIAIAAFARRTRSVSRQSGEEDTLQSYVHAV